ncbi:glycosyltransferase family 4 protein [Lutibacter sp.]|uniref:glycosyltransferase family 4 protein n=1 Tax=Lutibacter sp. TaxID=1925666 RepID=UPI0034A017A5
MSSFKKILIITSEFPPQPGGIGNHAYNLATQLQLNGYKVTLLTDLRSKKGVEEQQFDAKLPFKVVRIKRYKISVNTYLKRIFKYRSLVTKNTMVLASGKFSLWMVGLDPLLKNKNKYAVIHGSELNLKGFNKKITNNALLNFKKVIAVSNFTKSLVTDLKLSNVTVIPNGFNLENSSNEKPIDKGSKDLENPILITVGNVTERKGQLNVIKALPLLKEEYPKIHYHIVGIPTIQQELELVAEKLNVADHITFHGLVTEQKKQQLLQESTIFVMLSTKTATGDVEGFGIAIIEANAIGLPAIGSNTSGIVDAINNGVSGKLVDPTNKEAILNAVTEISNNYKNYSINATAWSTQFKWEVIIKKYVKTFE